MNGLPGGAVTFLFTDIEGSTRLVKALRERYPQVLADHRRLIRAAIAAHDGHEVDTQGDAFFVAFAGAKQAVLCALAIQRALAAHAWPAEGRVRVRIGVHTGHAVPSGAMYTGLAVHRAARICAAAYGGQVLVSQATQSIIADEEEHDPGFGLVDLGERRLKDLDRPVRLFQLAAPGLSESAEASDSGHAADSTVRPGRGAALEGEHKQATVLYCQLADGAAVARKLGTDGMLAFLDSFFEQAEAEVRRFEGTITSFLSDGLVALFGVPVAHEDHARRGVLAALGLQRRLTAAPAGEDALGSTAGLLRMALNTGLVAVSQIGSGPERRLSAVGGTAPVAGILQQQAEPGAILIGPATARMVAGYVRLEDLGSLQLPGTGGPVQAFRVTGTGPRRSPIEGLGARPLSRFVGREPEMRAPYDVPGQVAVAPELSARPKLAEFIGREHALAALRAPLAKVEAGHGQVVGIVGEPGIGKSRLLYEFRRSLAARQITYLEGRCLSFGGSVPYLPIVDVVRANCGIVDTDPPEVVSQRVRF